MKSIVAVSLLFTLFMSTLAQQKPRAGSRQDAVAGYWPLEKSQPIIDKTQTIRLAPDMSQLSAGERDRGREAAGSRKDLSGNLRRPASQTGAFRYRDLVQLDKRNGSKPETQNLLTLYRLNQGPIATTLENKREPFLSVDPVAPGKNMYPWGVSKEEIEKSFASGSANRDDLLDQRSVVRAATPENLRRTWRRS
jgi:hypothetical protein